tara:strand:+ start:7653 stop:7799 length:147 start_codon:yes stop_codon:yes gene_type:complete
MTKKINGYTLEEALEYADSIIKEKTDLKEIKFLTKAKEHIKICYERNY